MVDLTKPPKDDIMDTIFKILLFPYNLNFSSYILTIIFVPICVFLLSHNNINPFLMVIILLLAIVFEYYLIWRFIKKLLK